MDRQIERVVRTEGWKENKVMGKEMKGWRKKKRSERLRGKEKGII